ncbi:MAG: response regulator, partial [Pseudomonadota bacterium]
MAKVLLADDEALVARLYARAVEVAGHEPSVVTDGEAAFQAIVDDPPALLLTDLNMPGLSGDRLAARLLERGLKTFPIILMSADDTTALVVAGVR